jgi:hypothetical protein
MTLCIGCEMSHVIVDWIAFKSYSVDRGREPFGFVVGGQLLSMGLLSKIFYF